MSRFKPAAPARGRDGREGVDRVPSQEIVLVPPKPPLPWKSRRVRMRRVLCRPQVLLSAYVIALMLIALWPSPVDRGAGRILAWISRTFPVLTYARIELLSNVVLFVPLGILLMLILAQRWLIVPIALVATCVIEGVQAVFLVQRTPSVHDILANLSGACVGVLIVAFLEWLRRRR